MRANVGRRSSAVPVLWSQNCDAKNYHTKNLAAVSNNKHIYEYQKQAMKHIFEPKIQMPCTARYPFCAPLRAHKTGTAPCLASKTNYILVNISPAFQKNAKGNKRSTKGTRTATGRKRRDGGWEQGAPRVTYTVRPMGLGTLCQVEQG